MKGNELRCLAGCYRQTRYAAFQRRHSLLKHICGGIHDPRVNITELLQLEKIGRMFRTVKCKRSSLINRNSRRMGGSFRLIARMYLQRIKM